MKPGVFRALTQDLDVYEAPLWGGGADPLGSSRGMRRVMPVDIHALGYRPIGVEQGGCINNQIQRGLLEQTARYMGIKTGS